MKSNPITEITTIKGIKLIVGQHYIIDKEFRNGGEIELVKIYGQIYCRVKDPETNSEWDTMCNRLSYIGENEKIV